MRGFDARLPTPGMIASPYEALLHNRLVEVFRDQTAPAMARPPYSGTMQRTLADRVNDRVSVLDFGATGDGATDDTVSFQAALDSGCPVYVPYAPLGYKVTTLNLTVATRLFGDARKSLLLHYGSASLFNIKTSNITIEGLFVDAVNATAGEVFDFRTDVASLERITIRDVEASSANGLMVDRNSSGTLAVLYVYNVISRYNKGRGVYLRDTTGYIKFEDLTIDYVGSSSKDAIGIHIAGNRGMQLSRCDVTGGFNAATTNNNIGFLLDNCDAVWITGCLADSCGANGFVFQNGCANINVSQCTSSLCCGHQFVIDGSDRMMLGQCTALGRNGLANKAATKHGFVGTNGADHWQVLSCSSMYNTGDGYNQDGATGLILTGSRTHSNTGVGLRTVGAGSYSLASGSQFVSDGTGNYNIATTLDHLAGCQINSGALVTVTGAASG